MQFKEITGQQETAAKLVQGVTRGRISHAQLFIGGEGVGALPLAIAYAQYLNCTDRRDGDSCGNARPAARSRNWPIRMSISSFRSTRRKENRRARSR